ncbi:MAG: DUF4847 family protein [Bacteroidaceae bacterium]|nr:DUF4847 family protein [Bacteroidaceae bacterium]
MSGKTIRYTFLCLIWVCLTCNLTGCNDEDSIEIFVGRTWKISNLFDAQGKPLEPDEGKIVGDNNDAFYLKFETATTFVGKTREKNFSGTWSVNLKNHQIELTFKNTGNPTDALSKQVVTSLQRVDKYDGTYTYLKLEESDSPAYILFRPLN